MPILTAQERVGTIVDGKIRLDRILGEGGMGVVYAGMHLRLERPVAVKFLHAQFSQHQEVVSRFLTEARATSRLTHPNVIDVRDVDMSPDGCVYMVLELLQGQSLGDYLESKGRLDLEEAIGILAPVMDALAAAHAAGITHRDIKPDNIFLSRTPDGRLVPKVLDFGIAKLADAGSSSSATATGSVMGTPMYMAPEQAMGRTKEIGAVSDVWSTAVMTYQCLTGSLPFEVGVDAVPAAMILALMTATIVPITQHRRDLPPAVAEVLARALDRNPATRTQTMRELLAGLTAASQMPVPEARIDASGETQLPDVFAPRTKTGPSVWGTAATRAAPATGSPVMPEPPAAQPLPAQPFPAQPFPAQPVPVESAFATHSGVTAIPGVPTKRPWLWVAGVVTLLLASLGIAAATGSLSSDASATVPAPLAPALPVPTVAVTPVPSADQARAIAPETELPEAQPAVADSPSTSRERRGSHAHVETPQAPIPGRSEPTAPVITPRAPATPAERPLEAPVARATVGTPPIVTPPVPHVEAVEHRAGSVSLDQF